MARSEEYYNRCFRYEVLAYRYDNNGHYLRVIDMTNRRFTHDDDHGAINQRMPSRVYMADDGKDSLWDGAVWE